MAFGSIGTAIDGWILPAVGAVTPSPPDVVPLLTAIAGFATSLGDRTRRREAIVGYLWSTGETEADGAERAGRWYEEIRQGKRHRDDGGRII